MPVDVPAAGRGAKGRRRVLAWWSPDPRGVLPIDGLRVSRSLRRSCRRLVLPEVPEDIYVEGLRELIRTDQAWIPEPDEGALYIRPCVFATDAALRVGEIEGTSERISPDGRPVHQIG